MVPEFAPWITNTIKVFELVDDVELHIISPHEYIYGIKEFGINKVHYHIFNPYIPLWGRHWPMIFRWDVWTNYAHNKKTVKKLVDRINPDIIHLQGAENPYYSTTAFQFIDKKPLVIALQRINIEALKANTHREIIEKAIIETAPYISIRTLQMEADIKAFLPRSKVYWVDYSELCAEPIVCKKEYDMVFFGRVCKDKGIEDLLDAMPIIRKSIANVKLSIIGCVPISYKKVLNLKVKNLGITENVEWKGHLPTIADVHNEASKAKVSVLPTYNDTIPGTILESMQLGLPIVSYKTGSIPELNASGQNVLLADVGDVSGLALNILKLLTDDTFYTEMSIKGIECIKKLYQSKNILKQHLDCYHAVIEDYKRKHQL